MISDDEPIQQNQSLSMLQIVELFRDGYVGLATAKDLAHRHAGDLGKKIRWSSLQRNHRKDEDDEQLVQC
jgi:hypothetical protein